MDVTDAQPGLLLRGVGAGYGDGLVLQHVDLAVPPGTLVGVIGPNGSGKSTLLKAILGLAPVSTGTVLLDGLPVAEQRDRVAYVPQREAVDWSFPITAAQVVMMGRYPPVGWLRTPGPTRPDGRRRRARARVRLAARRGADRCPVGRTATTRLPGARAGAGGVGAAPG